MTPFRLAPFLCEDGGSPRRADRDIHKPDRQGTRGADSGSGRSVAGWRTNHPTTSERPVDGDP